MPCAQVVSVDATSLTLRRLESVAPTPEAAHVFGRRLAATHDAGAAAFGAGPDGWDGPGFFGPLSQPLPMSLRPHRRWGDFYADERLAPMAELAAAAARCSDPCRDRLGRGSAAARVTSTDDDQPARLHGDLWGGNVMWTPDGVVLIDPAAHAGHRESDLAMLALFGCPHYDAIIAGYQQVRSLKPGWRNRIGLHQLFPLLAHVVLFGGGYAARTDAPPAPRWPSDLASVDCPRSSRRCAARIVGGLKSKRDDDRRVDATSDATVPAQRHAGLAAALDRRAIPDTDIPIEATVASMDAADVDLGLLSAWRGPNGQDLISNDEVAEWISLHPNRFAGLATVDLDRPMEAVRELRRRIEDGFVGLRVVPWLWNAPPTDRRYYPLFAECVESGVPFCTQVGHTGPLRPVGDRTPDSLHRPGGPRLP